ncbi:MAG: hypothetical protein OEW71_04535 [Candidatus Bathyarchaeota archaeon]|nr:hypothetical protein [Candidatus Bathyarchaeota archaeon]
MDSKDFLKRPEGVAFWTMMLLSFAFLTYSYAIAQIVDWFLLFVLIMAGLIFRVAWILFAWRRPLSVPVEKVERASFWMTNILSLALLVSEYLTASLFNYYLFYIFIAGLLAYCVVAVMRK